MHENKNVMLHNRLAEHLDEALKSNPKVEDWFLIAVNGSYNYDLDTSFSDLDSKLLAVPTFEQLVDNSKINSLHIMSDNGEHCEIKDLRLYFHSMLKQNINFVETLYAKSFIINPRYQVYWNMIQDMRDAISQCNPRAALSCMRGMAHQKRKDMVNITPGREESIRIKGYDVKSFHHIL